VGGSGRLEGIAMVFTPLYANANALRVAAVATRRT
jgi:hypothetical protein